MSDHEPTKVYVTQPHPVSKKDGKLWRIGGLPADLDLGEAEAIVDAINEICWVMDQCWACGHMLAFASTGCPQCETVAIAPWFSPKQTAQCGCPRCVGTLSDIKK